MNSFNIIGRVGQDIELKEIGNDHKKVVNFSIAESTGKDTVAWWYCQAWGQTAEFIAKYVKKGEKVAIGGKMEQREYETKEGAKKTSYQINVRDIDPFLNGSKSNDNGAQQSDETPF